MHDKKSFLSLVLEHCGKNKNQAAVALGWSPARVWYLCSDKAQGFPMNEIMNLKEKLGISKITMLKLLGEYLFNNK